MRVKGVAKREGEKEREVEGVAQRLKKKILVLFLFEHQCT
jgi:hypothetical protein